MNAGISYDLDAIARINADCPLLDVSLLDHACKIMRERSADIITNIFPRSFPFGVVIEVLRTEVFVQGYYNMATPVEFEHVTKHFYDQSKSYNIRNIKNQNEIHAKKMLNYRFTVDTPHQLDAYSQRPCDSGDLVNRFNISDCLLFLR
jgi:spore coat polysaccharide biosynthesis protein SpsF (cytidylyltransferase family)